MTGDDAVSRSSPFDHSGRNVRVAMNDVLLALVPGVIIYIWLFGFGVVIHMALALLAAVGAEVVVLWARGLPVSQFVADHSVAVLALLLALAIPPYAPWWVTIVAAMVATLIGKHAYGGLGQNIFNPAMLGYVFVLLCFPSLLSRWPDSAAQAVFWGPIAGLSLVFEGAPETLDAISGATVLDHVKTQRALMQMLSEMDRTGVFGVVAGRGWEWVNLGFLLGGLWLCFRRVVNWRIPAAVVAGIGFAALLGYMSDPDVYRGPLYHLLAGASILTAFFIATDPVTAATTPRGMWIYGIGIGLITYSIRRWGEFPDGAAFAVLFMNFFAPLIDRLTQPRVYGQRISTGE